MFYVFCKTILHLHGRHAFTISRFPTLHCLQLLSIKRISTKTTSNQHSITVSYLVNSCGLSPQSALSASKYVHFESLEKPDSVITLFKNHGFTKSQISRVIRINPRVLTASPEKTLLPKLEFLKSKGFSIPELAHTLSICPTVLLTSLENHLIPTFDYLIDLLQSPQKIVAAIRNCPRIILVNLETYLLPNVNILRNNGVPESNIAMMFLHYWNRILLTRPESFKNIVEVVKEMGFNPLRPHFVEAIVAKGVTGRTKWESKVNVYKRWGWSEEELLGAFAKHPRCMMISEDKIMAMMDFFVNKMGWDSSVIARRPRLVDCSLEMRIIPRAAVLQLLLSKGLMKSTTTNSTTLFEYTEKLFLKRFVNSFEEAPELLKLYKEKKGLSKITKESA